MTARKTALGAALIALGTIPAIVSIGATAGAAGKPDPAVMGSFGPLFEEPRTLAGDVDCEPADGKPNCKPAAMAIAQLSNGSLVYWDGLEGMNRVKFNVVAEFGDVAENDQSRVLDLGRHSPVFRVPSNPRSNFGTGDGKEFLPGVPVNNSPGNDSDLFCSSLVQLANGKLLVAGGTGYYQEPGVPGTGYGVSELEGLRMSRLFDPATNSWKQAATMHYGRWYPSLVTLPDGKVFVASGVTKLLKPVYPDRVMDSGTNVKETETYNPVSNKWTVNPSSADKTLPLFPRLHLLPDGHIYYDAAGQAFNPVGESYDEALWNMASSYDPKKHTWTDLGFPTIGGLPLGFRGSGFSLMLPLTPDFSGRYTKAQFLSAGGVIGVTPGSYFATDTSTLNTVDTAHGDKLTSIATGSLTQPRWYSTGVLLPTGQVFAVNGTSGDEVLGPGTSFPITQSELWNPATKTWSVAADEAHGRAYHNTALLLADGRVLVSGHAPIATGYAFQTDAGAETLGTSRAEADPTFQVYSPPYLFWGPRPVISAANPHVRYTSRYTVRTPDAGRIANVVLVRNTSLTHLVDGDQRTVDLRIVRRSAHSVTVSIPGPTVLPPGPYLLFVNARNPKGLVPSVGRQTFVGARVPSYLDDERRLSHGRAAPAVRPAQATALGAVDPTVGHGQDHVTAQRADTPLRTTATSATGSRRSVAPDGVVAATLLLALLATYTRVRRRRVRRG